MHHQLWKLSLVRMIHELLMLGLQNLIISKTQFIRRKKRKWGCKDDRNCRFKNFYQRKKKVLRFRLILRDHLIISSKCLVTSARHHSRKSSICTIAEINHRKLQESKPTGGWYFFICIIKLLNHRKKAPQICPDLSICKNIGVSENKKK